MIQIIAGTFGYFNGRKVVPTARTSAAYCNMRRRPGVGRRFFFYERSRNHEKHPHA